MKEKPKETEGRRRKTSRRFTIAEPAMDRTGSELRMRGAWLRSAGFEPGARATATLTAPGVMEIRADSAMYDEGPCEAAPTAPYWRN